MPGPRPAPAGDRRPGHGPEQPRTPPRPAGRPGPRPDPARERRGAFGVVLQLFATSQFFADILTANPDFLETSTAPLRGSPTPAELVAALRADVIAATDDAGVLRAFRRFRHRQLLRIGINDIIRDRPLEEITRDLSPVADAALEVALATAHRTTAQRFGEPRSRGRGAAVLAFGKLGGEELNYSSDIDLMFVYDEDGRDRAARRPASATTSSSPASSPRWSACCRPTPTAARPTASTCGCGPEGQRGPLARSLASTLSYYDTLGRTWERQALIKVRPVAGDPRLGAEFLAAIEPFVYRKYFSFAEINEIKALKRRIEQQADRGRRPTTATSRPATAASATSSSPSSSCNCSTAATCPRSASATPCWPCRPSKPPAA